MRSRWPGRIATLALAGGVVAALAWAFRPLPVEVDTSVVARGDVVVTVDEDGRTRVRERYVVAAPLGGRLRRIALDAGDEVRRGETVVAVIEPRLPEPLDERERLRAEAAVGAARSARSRAEATLEAARLDHDHATRESDRLSRAAGGGAAPVRELDAARRAELVAAEIERAAEHALRVAEFETQQAEAALAVVSPAAGDGRPPDTFAIRAPADGRVLRLRQESETVVAAGTPLVELGDPADLEVVVDVLSRDAVRIAPGTQVRLEQWGGDAPLAARVRRVDPAAFTKVSALGVEEQRVPVIADLDVPPDVRARLGDAYRVEARIVVDRVEDVPLVPAGAVFREGDGWAVFRVEQGRARLRTVEVGLSDGRRTEVRGGLAEGDAVVVHPTSDVADGVEIRVRESDK